MSVCKCTQKTNSWKALRSQGAGAFSILMNVPTCPESCCVPFWTPTSNEWSASCLKERLDIFWLQMATACLPSADAGRRWGRSRRLLQTGETVSGYRWSREKQIMFDKTVKTCWCLVWGYKKEKESFHQVGARAPRKKTPAAVNLLGWYPVGCSPKEGRFQL